MEHFPYLYDLNSYAYNRKETGCTHPMDIHLSAVQPKKNDVRDNSGTIKLCERKNVATISAGLFGCNYSCIVLWLLLFVPSTLRYHNT